DRHLGAERSRYAADRIAAGHPDWTPRFHLSLPPAVCLLEKAHGRPAATSSGEQKNMMGVYTCGRPLLLPLLLSLCGLAAAAETAAPENVVPLQPVGAAAVQDVGSVQALSFRQLGALYPLQLRGVDG